MRYSEGDIICIKKEGFYGLYKLSSLRSIIKTSLSWYFYGTLAMPSKEYRMVPSFPFDDTIIGNIDHGKENEELVGYNVQPYTINKRIVLIERIRKHE